jgi:acetolactate synthase small subunit
MPPLGFEPNISVLERAKTVRALDRATTAIGDLNMNKFTFNFTGSKDKIKATLKQMERGTS